MLQPAAEPIHITIALPQTLVDSLGVGAEVLAKYLTELAEPGGNDPANHPPPLPILCRVCERSIVPWWFEKHSDLCVQEHKAELDVQMSQEALAEHRHTIAKVLDAFEAHRSRAGSGDNSPALSAIPEYKGLPIGPPSNPSSSTSSGPTSHPATPTRSRSPAAGLGHARAKSFAVRRPLARIVELILDLCDTALEICIPAIKDTKSDTDEEFRTQSPQSESRISQVLQWQQPTSLEHEPGLAALSVDTERLARAKVEAVHRHRVIIEYSERIRQEYIVEVDACIAEALEKAERAAAGESLSSGESEIEEEERITEEEEPTPLALEPTTTETQPYVGLRSIASAIRNPSEIPPIPMVDSRRPSSTAISSRSSSPMECPTPRSHRSTLLAQPQPLTKRGSIYTESEANDSDSSLPSLNSAQWRTDSPASEHGLSRAASSRDRKRRSLHLHGLSSGSPRRQQSPARYPQAPPSPLRMNKPRLPSGESMPSPIISPLLTAGEFMPQSMQGHHHLHHNHHRRQSSVHSSDNRPPGSPHLSSVNIPQPRVQPPSIKDFEIIKPISKGAFGSVYLSKKKLTGEYFAIKVLRKSDMVAKNQVTNVKAERAIMMWQGESDFVAKLYWTFSSKDFLFLVMEYLNGGDCASLVKVLGGLTEDWAKKYIAEVVLGVEHLHSRGIVHRDLKPDNLLIDSKGHLKLTDFGLSRMGLVGRQKRVLKSPEGQEAPAPDLLRQGPFTRETSTTSSRSASFDFLGTHSPNQTPLMTPALTSGLDQPSYFNLNRDGSFSREPSRKSSGHRSDLTSISSQDLHSAFRSFSIHDAADIHAMPTPMPMPMPPRSLNIEEETNSQGSASPDLFPLSQSMSNISQAPPPPPSQMLPPAMALFDPEDNTRRFVGTPDYLAPETISGAGQDEMSDWWSLGCILFEFLYGFPPFNADSTDAVFENILNRRIAWPEESDYPVSDAAKDLINKLIQLDPRQRLGANSEDKFPSGGAEIKAHPWFSDINWDTFMEDEAQFIPNPENPEDTEYFDARGATLQSFPEELEDQVSPPGVTPGGTEYAKRPHDALLHVRNQVNSMKRGLMPLHIPPHVARDTRSRRLSEPVPADDFGNFTFKNLPVLEKANKDIVNKMREEAMQAQARGSSSQTASSSNTPASHTPSPSLEGSPLLPMPLKRAISMNRGHQRGSPSGPSNATSSPSRPSQPSSPLLVQFSTRQSHERRKTSGSSQSSSSAQTSNVSEQPRDGNGMMTPAASSPVKAMHPLTTSPAKLPEPLQRSSSMVSRSRSQTVGSQEGDNPRDSIVASHYKRRSQLLAHEISPSSSDNENNPQAKALLKVQRRRQSSRRLSQITMTDGPFYRPLDILICEDHPVSKMVMERLFEKLRCQTVTASNGSEAMRLAVSQIPFDIIFMEYKLPVINGVDVARMVRDTTNANTRTPIVAVTGYLKELPEVHKFDTLIQKPPTLTRLTEVLCKYCSWKPPPKDFKPSALLGIPPLIPRLDTQQNQGSPSSTASSMAPTMPDSSYKSSSRENSVGSSSFFGDMDSTDLPVIISRQATGDWGGKGGLGISHDIITEKKPYLMTGYPPLIHAESAPASATLPTAPVLGLRTPRRKTSTEDIKAKRESLEKKRADGKSAESGDDEDEELGDMKIRTRSPHGATVRQSSRLGYEMLRTNSRGSVISNADDGSVAEPETLRKSLEIIEQRMEGLRIPEELDAVALAAAQPRKLERSISQHSHPAPSLDAEDRPSSRGHITPPVLFPQRSGAVTKEFDMDPEVTPVPTKVMDLREEPTPRPQGSSSHISGHSPNFF
jgi:serine/threonine-protein kinase RIM15